MRAGKNEDGFTLLELLLAFSVLTIMALAALPLMVNGLRISADSAITTSANQRVQQAIESARQGPVTCQTLATKTGTQTYNDGRGNNFRVATSLPSGCNASATTAQAVPVRVIATRTRDNKVLTTAITKIFIAGPTT